MIGVKKILLKIIFDFVVNLIYTLKIDYYHLFIWYLNFINVLHSVFFYKKFKITFAKKFLNFRAKFGKKMFKNFLILRKHS